MIEEIETIWNTIRQLLSLIILYFVFPLGCFDGNTFPIHKNSSNRIRIEFDLVIAHCCMSELRNVIADCVCRAPSFKGQNSMP